MHMKRLIISLLLLTTCSYSLLAQSRDVHGVVKDEGGGLMPGVAVSLKGSTKGVFTDSDGKYSLTVPEKSTLVFSFVGYASQEVAANKNVVDVTMVPDAIDMGEIVVVGYGTQKRENLTGAVETMSVKDMASRPITSLANAMQGLAAGVDVIQGSGEPGADDATVRIRGISSLENNNEPLVIVDGLESTMSAVNPKDIESISVLKDAASASIYGVRAAAGVILITTKSGTEGKLRVNASASYSLQQATALPDYVSGEEWCLLNMEAHEYQGTLTAGIISNRTQLINGYRDGTRIPSDFQKEYISVAPMQEYYVNVSGGNRYFKGSFSGGYLDQDGTLVNTNTKKYNFRTNLDGWTENRKLNIKFNASGYRQDKLENPSEAFYVMGRINSSNPTLKFIDENGLYGYNAQDFAIKEKGGGANTTQYVMNSKLAATAYLPLGFELQAVYGFSLNDLAKNTYVPPFYTSGTINEDDGSRTVQRNYIRKRNQQSFSSTFEALLRYNFSKFGHKVNALLGYSQMAFKNDWTEAQRDYLTAEYPELTAGDPSTQTNNSNSDHRAIQSVFGRVNYSYKDRYLFEANIRGDGSSRFHPDRRWAYFPSVSAAWRITEEEFFKNISALKFVNNLKIRASWGKLGNEGINSYYAYMDLLTNSNYVFNGSASSGYVLNTLADKNTSWENTAQTNIGLDIGLFKQLTITLDAYYKKTSDILMKIPVAPSLGLKVDPYQNVGSMENKGIELGLNYRRKIGQVSFSAGGTFAVVKNKVLALNSMQDYFFHATNQVLISKVGESYGSYYGYEVDRIFQIEDFTWDYNSDPTVPINERNYKLKPGIPSQAENPRPGDFKFKDISGPDGKPDGVIDLDYDRTVIGKQFPDFTYSLNLSAEWKGFDVNVFFNGVQGRQLYDQGSMTMPFYNLTGNVTRQIADNHWTMDNRSNDHPRLFTDKVNQELRSSYYVQNASYLRLKNVELGYTISAKWLQNLKVESLRAYIGVQNVFTISKYTGFDPERSPTRINSDGYPLSRVYTCGLNLVF